MFKRRKEEEELKVYRVTVQVSEKEKMLINKLAKNCGMNVGAYVRKLCIYDQWERLGNEVEL